MFTGVVSVLFPLHRSQYDDKLVVVNLWIALQVLSIQLEHARGTNIYVKSLTDNTQYSMSKMPRNQVINLKN